MRQKGPGSDTLFISLKIRKQPKQYQPNKKNTCNYYKTYSQHTVIFRRNLYFPIAYQTYSHIQNQTKYAICYEYQIYAQRISPLEYTRQEIPYDIRSIKKYDATDRKFNFFISNTILWLHFQKIITFSE